MIKRTMMTVDVFEDMAIYSPARAPFAILDLRHASDLIKLTCRTCPEWELNIYPVFSNGMNWTCYEWKEVVEAV